MSEQPPSGGPAADPMAEIKQSFFAECEELLEALQDALIALDETLDDDDGGPERLETINTAFRAVHSIKGGAGAFGLAALVGFAHRFETVLDALRSGRMPLSAEALKRFFHAADLLADHVQLARSDAHAHPPGSEEALEELEALPGADEAGEEIGDNEFTPMALSLGGPAAGPTGWKVHFRPLSELYHSGNEALHLLRALAALGEARITCDPSALPPLTDLDPEDPALAWHIELPGSTNEDEIQAIFEFVEGLAEITVTPIEDDDAAGGDPLAAFLSGGLAPFPDSAFQDSGDASLGAFDGGATMGAGASEQAAMRPFDPSGADAAPAPVAAADHPAAEAPGADRRATASESAGGKREKSSQDSAQATVRVDLDRIDRLVNLVGELVINQAMLAQSVAKAGIAGNSAVMSGLEAFTSLTRDIQDSVMMIRAQPVKPLFQRMARILREASAQIGKEVRLKAEGEATEVDKTVIERLADPLTHMIRNAVDHGLESREARIEAGKPVEGTITLSAQHRSGRVVIEVADDGGGINRAKVRETAIKRGLISPDLVLSDSETDNLLFLPGFSTADQVSALSGRGVGMDVVRQAIQALGGRISIASERGKGTRFSISLPLTLAVLDGMVVRIAGETVVVPLSTIVETVALSASDLRAVGPEARVIQLRGGFVPLYDLGTELGFRPIPIFNQQFSPGAGGLGGIVLLTALEDGSRVALTVDQIVEQRQVVIKGLQRSCGKVPGVAAATILGDGQIALILDPADVVRNATARARGLDSFDLAG